MGTLFVDVASILGVTVSPYYSERGLTWVSVIGMTAENRLVDYVCGMGLVPHEKIISA